MNELAKRKKELDEEFEEVMEMEDDAINTRSRMTIAAVAQLLKLLNEHVTDMAEIANAKKYYDENLTSALQTTVSQLISAFSQIQPPTINVTPQLKFDIQPLQNIASKISEQNGTLINLIGKFNNNQNEQLVKLITTLVEKQVSFLEREIKQIDYTQQFSGLEKAINNRPTEFKSKVTNYNNQGRIDEITTKVIK